MMEDFINSYRRINLGVGEIKAAIKKTECIWLTSLLEYFIKQAAALISFHLFYSMAGVAEVSGHLSSAQDQCLGQ